MSGGASDRMQAIQGVLQHAALLKMLTSEQRHTLAQIAEEQTFAGGERIVAAGAPQEAYLIVTRGGLVDGVTGVRIAGTGEAIGEGALLSSGSVAPPLWERSLKADASAADGCDVVVLKRAAVLAALGAIDTAGERNACVDALRADFVAPYVSQTPAGAPATWSDHAVAVLSSDAIQSLAAKMERTTRELILFAAAFCANTADNVTFSLINYNVKMIA